MKTIKRVSELNRLFNQLQELEPKLKIRMDYNAIYGGYKIQVICVPGTGERDYDLLQRVSKKEMVCYLLGVLKGYDIKK
jgi:hypothetical protein